MADSRRAIFALFPTIPTETEIRNLCRKLAIDLHFQPSEIDKLTLSEALWWITDSD
jgi:hypothetical protein